MQRMLSQASLAKNSRWCVKRVQLRTFSISVSSKASAVRIIEVGPRDGLQNIKKSIPTSTKIELIQRLAATGLKNIEATSFVSPKWVPQLADGAEVMSRILPMAQERQIRLPVLTPNMRGLENAIKSGAKEVVVFASCTEAFSKKNQNCSIEEALQGAQQVTEKALKHGIAVRGVVSCIFSDPYSGPTPPQDVLSVVQRLLDMGCYEVGLGDTLGVGTPKDTQVLLEHLLKSIPADKLAGHFHDTYGQAVANVVRAYDMGIRTFDSSVAGLGGCPYAPGAKGNAATEDIVYTLEKSGINTGIDLDKLVDVGGWISRQLDQPNGSRAGTALFAKGGSTTKKPIETTPQSTRNWKVTEDAGEYIVSRSGNAVKITLNRPKNGNALTEFMVDGLTNLFQTLAHDRSVFHIVLDSSGKFFCTGMDLSGGTDTSNMESESSYYSKVKNLFAAIDNSPQTTIVLIDAPCFGGGVGVSFVCDIRLVSAKARWTLSEIKLGLSPATISPYLVREWGMSFLREAMLTAREVSPYELQRIGAVHGVAEDSEKLQSMLNGYLDRLSQCAPQSGAACKELARLAWTDAGGQKQDNFIRQTFDNMMAPGSEGRFGIEQFQKKIKKIDWASFWAGRGAKL